MKRISWLILLFFVLGNPSVAQAEDFSYFLGNSEKIKEISENVNLKYGDKNFELSKKEVSSWIKEKIFLTLAYDSSYFSELEKINFCQEKKSFGCRLSFPYILENKIRKKSHFYLNEKAAEKYLEEIALQGDRDPRDAKFKIENNRAVAFSLEQKGLRLKKEESLSKLEEYFKKEDRESEIDLVYEEINPEISIESIENLGIVELIGEGKSNFKGSPSNRIFNIRVATEKFNGIIVKPKEEFSFVKNLGEVDGEHGYKPELVIKNDKTEPEFGGGICQVSTTVFRAAVYSGLPITARKNHAYPVSYYNPQGMDATIYIPRPDLKFVNDTPGHILIEASIEGTELIFRFYGTSDGRKTKVLGPRILEKNPDGSMKTTFTQQIFDKDEQFIREDVFPSAYDSPSKYPHPGEENLITKKPKNWSDREWKEYKKNHNL